MFTLISADDCASCRAECIKLLESFGASVIVEDADGWGVLKCRVDEIRGGSYHCYLDFVSAVVPSPLLNRFSPPPSFFSPLSPFLSHSSPRFVAHQSSSFSSSSSSHSHPPPLSLLSRMSTNKNPRRNRHNHPQTRPFPNRIPPSRKLDIQPKHPKPHVIFCPSTKYQRGDKFRFFYRVDWHSYVGHWWRW